MENHIGLKRDKLENLRRYNFSDNHDSMIYYMIDLLVFVVAPEIVVNQNGCRQFSLF